MAEYQYEHRFQFDWNRNGRFDHPLSDVSEDHMVQRLRWGCAADSPVTMVTQPGSQAIRKVGGILADSAIGTISLFNRNGKFDPDNPRLQVDEIQLRSPTPCRVLYDDRQVWNGLALPQYGPATRDVQNFQWKLEGVHAEDWRSHVSVQQPPGALSSITDGDLPVSFATSTRPIALGVAPFEGTRIKRYEALARIAGGWMVENERGEMQLRTMSDAFADDSVVFLDKSFDPYTGEHVRELDSLVATRVLGQALAWQKVIDETTGQDRIVSVGTARYRVGPLSSQTFTFRPGAREPRIQFSDAQSVDSHGNQRLIREWLTPEATNATVIVRDSSASEQWIRFTLVSAPGGDISVSFPAYVSELKSINHREIILQGPERTYGRRDLGIEPWLTPNLDGLEKVIAPFLDNLSEPLEYVNVTYSEWQETASKLHTLIAATPGRVVDMQLDTQEKSNKVVKVLILAVRLNWARGAEPTRTLYGLVVRDLPPRPLVALEAFAQGPFEIEAQVRISETDPNKRMYVDVTEVT